jgi:hypothetical protein
MIIVVCFDVSRHGYRMTLPKLIFSIDRKYVLLENSELKVSCPMFVKEGLAPIPGTTIFYHQCSNVSPDYQNRTHFGIIEG